MGFAQVLAVPEARPLSSPGLPGASPIAQASLGSGVAVVLLLSVPPPRLLPPVSLLLIYVCDWHPLSAPEIAPSLL